MARRRRLTPAQPGYAETATTQSATPSGLSGAGLSPRVAPIAQVSGQSAEAAALREMAEGIQAARDEGRMIVEVPLTDISPGFLMRDRISLDREELEALKASIREFGQRTPAEIAPLDPGSSDPRFARETDGARMAYRFGLISGWRRLTALNELHSETGDPRFSTLRALIRQVSDAAESYITMVEENEIRVGLSYYERARMVAELTTRGVFEDQSVALRRLFANASRAKRSKIGSFVDLVVTLGPVLRFPADIPERLGLALVARLRHEPGLVPAVERALQQAAPATAKAELAVLESFSRPPKAEAPRKTDGFRELLRPNLTLKTEQKRGQLTLTFTGSDADARLLEQIKTLLRQSS